MGNLIDTSDLNMRSGNLKTFLVCGMTGVGKSTFINSVTGAQLSVSNRADSDTEDVIEEGIPLIKMNNDYIQLVDTPGFGDSREDNELVVFERITTWIVARYRSKVPVAGIMFLRPIHEVRVNRLEKSLMMMFKDLCGDDCLDHIFLFTTRWPSEISEEYEKREQEFVSRGDMLGSDSEKGIQVRRLGDGYSPEDARSVVESCTGLLPITFRIQREMADEGKSLGETEAGMRMGADFEQKLVGLEERVKKASEYAEAEKRRLEEAGNTRRRLEEAATQAVEEARQAEEAEKEAQRKAEIMRARMERDKIEGEEWMGKAEVEKRAAERAADEARARWYEGEERARREWYEGEERAKREREIQDAIAAKQRADQLVAEEAQARQYEEERAKREWYEGEERARREWLEGEERAKREWYEGEERARKEREIQDAIAAQQQADHLAAEEARAWQYEEERAKREWYEGEARAKREWFEGEARARREQEQNQWGCLIM